MEGNEEEFNAMRTEIVAEEIPEQQSEQINDSPDSNPAPEVTPEIAKETPSFDYSKYGVASEEELSERVRGYETYSSKVKELEEQLAKPKEYAWRSPAEKALADSLAGWTGDINEGITTHIKLKGLDVENMDGKDALKENFILSKLANPSMTRTKAEKLFDHKYGSMYDKANDEDEPDEVMKIELEEEEYNAKEALKQRQNAIKEAAEKAQVPTEPNQPEVAPEIINAMQQQTQMLPEVLKDFEKLTFPVGDNPEHAFNAALEKGELDVIRAEVENILKNPAYYDAKGNLNPEFSAKNVASRLVYALAGERLVKAALAHKVGNTQIDAIKQIEASAADRGNGSQGIGHVPANEYEAMRHGTGRG